MTFGVVSGEVEEVHASEDDEEAAEEGYCVDGIGRVEATEKDERGGKSGGGECYVVKWVDAGMSVSQLRSSFSCVSLHIRRKLTQSFVEVVHLRQNADHYHNYKHICRGMRELVIAPESELQGNTKCLDRHNGDGADCRADGDVDKRILATISWRNAVYHDTRKCCHHRDVEQKACTMLDHEPPSKTEQTTYLAVPPS